jgi:hypothetical protein
MSRQQPTGSKASPGGGPGGSVPGWVRRVETIRMSAGARRLFYAVLGLLVVMDLFVPKDHALFPFEALPGFSAVYGFISCVVIIIASKWIGHAGVITREDYYD